MMDYKVRWVCVETPAGAAWTLDPGDCKQSCAAQACADDPPPVMAERVAELLARLADMLLRSEMPGGQERMVGRSPLKRGRDLVFRDKITA
jgi:hypothetical protein